MPLQRGTTAAVASLAFVISWGNFLDPLIYIYDGRWFTVPLGMRSLSIVPVTEQPLMLAASVMACLPVVAAFLFVQRRLFTDPETGGCLVTDTRSGRRSSSSIGLVLAACTSDDASPAARRTDDRLGLGVGRPRGDAGVRRRRRGVRGVAGCDRRRPRRDRRTRRPDRAVCRPRSREASRPTSSS